MPSSRWATVSHASTAASSDSKTSFQRITTIGSMPVANSEATPSRLMPVALVLEAMDLDEVRREVDGRCAGSAAPRDLLARADEHVGELERLLHRRLDAVEAERVGGLLGVVDDVVERRRELRGRRRSRTAAGARRAPPLRRWMMSCAIRSPSCSQCRSSRDEVGGPGSRRGCPAAASAARSTLRPDSSRRSKQRSSGGGAGSHRRAYRRRAAPVRGAFTASSHGVHDRVTGAAPRRASFDSGHGSCAARRRCSSRRAARSGRVTGSCAAGGRSSRCRCASSSCWSRSLAARGGSSAREELFATVWGAPLRPGDRSVDVYVHKLRVKLEQALPDVDATSTRTSGFGYRFATRAFTRLSRRRPHGGNRLRPTHCEGRPRF